MTCLFFVSTFWVEKWEEFPGGRFCGGVSVVPWGPAPAWLTQRFVGRIIRCGYVDHARWVCKVPTNALNKVFETLHREAERGVADGQGYANALKYSLLRREGAGSCPGTTSSGAASSGETSTTSTGSASTSTTGSRTGTASSALTWSGCWRTAP